VVANPACKGYFTSKNAYQGLAVDTARPKAACPARLKPRPLTTLDYIGQERALHLKDVTPYTNGFVELRYEIRNSGTTPEFHD
jgi:hypothetical protein